MAAKTTLANIQAIAKDDAKIQALTGAETLVALVLDQVDRSVKEATFGTYTEEGQRYLGAHYLSMAFQPVGGRGPLSSEIIGGVSVSYTLPWLNRDTPLGGTQFGLQYLEILDKVVAPVAVIVPE